MNIKEQLQELEKKIESCPERKDFSGGVQTETIKVAERKLGILFPISYCWFLMTYGSGFWGEQEFFGVLENEDGDFLNLESIPNVVWVTEYLRKDIGLPEVYFAICGDGMGCYYCVKADKETREMDGNILCVNLADGGNEVYGNLSDMSFVEFMQESILMEE